MIFSLNFSKFLKVFILWYTISYEVTQIGVKAGLALAHSAPPLAVHHGSHHHSGYVVIDNASANWRGGVLTSLFNFIVLTIN